MHYFFKNVDVRTQGDVIRATFSPNYHTYRLCRDVKLQSVEDAAGSESLDVINPR